MLKLLLTKDNAIVHEYPLANGVTHIGRAANNEIRLTDLSVSANHAEIEIRANKIVDFIKDITLKDLKSTNGTLKNGDKIKQCRLSHGDNIQIGGLLFTFESDEHTDVDSTRIYLPDALP